jgi:Putative zinc- or iron-chelating domain
VSDDRPAVPPEVATALEALAGMVASDEDTSRKLEYILDTLLMRGQLPASFRRVVSRIRADRGTTVRLATFPDKYTLESPDIDCAARIPLCGARCCSFSVALSHQDVVERRLPFVIERPYELPRDPDTGRCTCMDGAGRCTVYDQRPGTCRTYDCRDDRRVWLDFEARIAAPMPVVK